MAGSFDLKDYVQVNERIDLFYKKYPEGSIQTEIISNTDGQVIFKAYVYRDREDTKPATGHAMEKEGSSFINKTSHIENCETSAVGRALAMLGFEIKKSIASQEEVANAILQQEELSQKIDKTTAKTLLKLIEEKGKDVQKICEYYHVKSIEDMTKEQAGKLKHQLAK